MHWLKHSRPSRPGGRGGAPPPPFRPRPPPLPPLPPPPPVLYDFTASPQLIGFLCSAGLAEGCRRTEERVRRKEREVKGRDAAIRREEARIDEVWRGREGGGRGGGLGD